jgi:hypothetical protein
VLGALPGQLHLLMLLQLLLVVPLLLQLLLAVLLLLLLQGAAGPACLQQLPVLAGPALFLLLLPAAAGMPEHLLLLGLLRLHLLAQQATAGCSCLLHLLLQQGSSGPADLLLLGPLMHLLLQHEAALTWPRSGRQLRPRLAAHQSVLHEAGHQRSSACEHRWQLQKPLPAPRDALRQPGGAQLGAF